MRIPIREQLGLLVLFCCVICLAIISAAVYSTSHHFVTNVRNTSLSLTALLYSQQLLSSLVLLRTNVQSIATRVLIQNAINRYNHGNTTAANWVNAQNDLSVALTSGGIASYAFQGRVVSKNGTGTGGPYGLLNVTGAGIPDIQLPYNHANGTPVLLGDADKGFPEQLYPTLNYESQRVNQTFNESLAFFDGKRLPTNATLFLGPWQLNETFGLCSITVPIINNTSSIDVLGWMTIVLNAQVIFDVANAYEGLGDSGVVLIVGPATTDNKLPSIERGSAAAADPKNKDIAMHFVIPPSQNSSRSMRHAGAAFGKGNPTFTLAEFPAVSQVVLQDNNAQKNSGSFLDTKNEDNDRVSTGFSLVESALVDWIIVVEQSYGEVVAPINHLRDVIIGCVFGTLGLVLVFLLPLAHYSVTPIRRLREATQKSVDPFAFASDHGDVPGQDDRSITSSSSIGSVSRNSRDEEAFTEIARKEGFAARMTKWRPKWMRPSDSREASHRSAFRIPGKVEDGKHVIKDELTDLTSTFNEMSQELTMQYERLEERVRARTKELELSKIAAEAANESKTLFIANISHELKTPLNGILGMCAVCMHEEDPTKIKRSLGIIYKSGDLLLNLLTDLLTFSKNQIGQQLSLDEKEFRLADISSQVLSIFDKQAKENSIKLRVNFEGPNESLETASGTPGQSGFGPFGTGRVKDMFLWGDQHRILQVVINLVSNSLKFTPAGGSVTVRIKCVGEVEEDKAASSRNSRKGSTQSKGSRASKGSKHGSRQNMSFRNGRLLTRGSESGSSMASADEKGKKSPEVNSRDSKLLPQVHVRERSISPPPINARTLLFEFEVEDTGPGIPQAQQQKVFEPFVQGDLGLSRKYGGTGLGLSICSQLAHLMKGSITLQSEEGQGSTFNMRVPLKFIKERADSTASSNLTISGRNSLTLENGKEPAIRTPRRSGSESELSTHSAPATSAVQNWESPASKPRLVGLSQPFFATTPPLDTPKAQLEAMERVAAEASKSGTKVRVLVAEDNKVNQEVVLRLLKLEDIFDVTIAKDGQEAFDLVKASMEQDRFYNLIFMDIQMPNLNGLESTRLIREMGYSAPIVALTAFAEESNVLECRDAGMDDFMSKPIRRPALKQVLSRYCPTIHEAAEEPDSPPATQKLPADSKLAATKAESKGLANTPQPVVSTPISPADEGISPFTQPRSVQP